MHGGSGDDGWAGPPVLLKTEPDTLWPRHTGLFYLVAREGLFRCRNHPFFESCVPAAGGPSSLESQAPFLRPRFPRIPRELFERVVGFFDRVARRHRCEAAGILVWDRDEERVRLVVPEQTATMSRAWDGYEVAVGVHYEPPRDLPESWVPFGDVHSHVYWSAYASGTDVSDELHSAGMHVVVGRLQHEPPDVHVEAVVDGMRFVLERSQVIEGYERRRDDVPGEWIERVAIEVLGSSWYGSTA